MKTLMFLLIHNCVVFMKSRNDFRQILRRSKHLPREEMLILPLLQISRLLNILRSTIIYWTKLLAKITTRFQFIFSLNKFRTKFFFPVKLIIEIKGTVTNRKFQYTNWGQNKLGLDCGATPADTINEQNSFFSDDVWKRNRKIRRALCASASM